MACNGFRRHRAWRCDSSVCSPIPSTSRSRLGSPSRGQQAFGRALLEQHLFVVIPSTVTQESWNLLFNPTRAAGRYELETQKRFALDTRLNPPERQSIEVGQFGFQVQV